ncbi:MAG: DNA glycosylase AlkZ-like family protein [Kosmotogaceae bacterium]
MAPLDNLLWDRKLVKVLFDFENVCEVYKPVKERKFGYYVLPVLYNDRFIARFEPEYSKKKKMLVIKNWWWEENSNHEIYREGIDDGLKNFMNYLGAESLRMSSECDDLKIISNQFR